MSKYFLLLKLSNTQKHVHSKCIKLIRVTCSLSGICKYIHSLRSNFPKVAFGHLDVCLFPPWEKCPTEDFFFSSGRSVSEGSLYPPRVVFTHERSEGCNWDPRGVKMPEDTLLSEEKKKSEVVAFFPWRMWLSSILEVIPTSSECLTI